MLVTSRLRKHHAFVANLARDWEVVTGRAQFSGEIGYGTLPHDRTHADSLRVFRFAHRAHFAKNACKNYFQKREDRLEVR